MKNLSVDEFMHQSMDVFNNFPTEYVRAFPERAKHTLGMYKSMHSLIRNDIYPHHNQFEELLHQTALWTVQAGYNLNHPLAAGLGMSALVYKVNDEIGYRFQVATPAVIDRIDHDLVLQPLSVKTNDRYAFTFEILEWADTASVTPRDLNEIHKKVGTDERIQYEDFDVHAHGFVRKKLRSLDPGAIKWKPGCRP